MPGHWPLTIRRVFCLNLFHPRHPELSPNHCQLGSRNSSQHGDGELYLRRFKKELWVKRTLKSEKYGLKSGDPQKSTEIEHGKEPICKGIHMREATSPEASDSH